MNMSVIINILQGLAIPLQCDAAFSMIGFLLSNFAKCHDLGGSKNPKMCDLSLMQDPKE